MRHRVSLLFVLLLCFFSLTKPFISLSASASRGPLQGIPAPGDKVSFSLTRQESYSGLTYRVDSGDDGGCHITADTSEMEEEYYTSYLYAETHGGLSDHGGIWFTAENQGSADISVGPAISDARGNLCALKTGNSYLEIHGDSLHAVTAEIDGIPVPAGASVTVCVPFSSLGADALSLSGASGIGYLVTVSQDSQCSLVLKDSAWLSPAEAQDLMTSLGAIVSGSSSLQIAVQGESISIFRVEGNPRNTYRFNPVRGVPGVELKENGRLVTTSQASPGTLVITATDDNGVTVSKEVELYLSWRRTTAASGLNRFLTPGEMPVPNLSFTEYFMGPSLLRLRIVLGAACLLVFGSYLFIRRRAAKKKPED